VIWNLRYLMLTTKCGVTSYAKVASHPFVPRFIRSMPGGPADGTLSTVGQRATLDDIPDAGLDRLADCGFDWVWFLGIWQTGPAGRKVSLENAEWRHEYQELLPDFVEEDVCGSCFAISSYTVHAAPGVGLGDSD
jgi:hypothetical protein